MPSKTGTTPLNLRKIHVALTKWYAANQRKLPWRETRDPYKIWLSEIMLQQTRVETVLPYYKKFIDKYPTVFDLACAPIDEIRALWAGLGYYSRAVNLHQAARAIVQDFSGRMPSTLTDLRILPGVGPYTAAAIASIAFDEAYAAIDGNLERVLARLLALRKIAKGAPEIAALAQGLVDLGDASVINQALMDISATLCARKVPNCLLCPLRVHCRASQENATATIPMRQPKRTPTDLEARGILLIRSRVESMHAASSLAQSSGAKAWVAKASGATKPSAEYEVLIARRPKGCWLQGMWDLPWWIPDRDPEPQIPHSHSLGTFQTKRTITHHRIRFQIRALELGKKIALSKIEKQLRSCGQEFRWEKWETSLEILPRPSLKILRAYEREIKSGSRQQS